MNFHGILNWGKKGNKTENTVTERPWVVEEPGRVPASHLVSLINNNISNDNMPLMAFQLIYIILWLNVCFLSAHIAVGLLTQIHGVVRAFCWPCHGHLNKIPVTQTCWNKYGRKKHFYFKIFETATHIYHLKNHYEGDVTLTSFSTLKSNTRTLRKCSNFCLGWNYF